MAWGQGCSSVAVAAEGCRCGSLTRRALRARSHERAGGRGGFHRRRALLWLPACGMQGEGSQPSPSPLPCLPKRRRFNLPRACCRCSALSSPGRGSHGTSISWSSNYLLSHPETKKERLFSAAEQTVRFLQQRGQRVPAPTLVGNRRRGLQP